MGNGRSGRTGLPFWIVKRIRRMGEAGFDASAIARATGVEQKRVRAIVRRGPRYRFSRCPECGGMVVPPCRACGMRIADSAVAK